jgi:hypothetical protein
MAQTLRPTTMTSDASTIIGAARALWQLRQDLDRQYYYSSVVLGDPNNPDWVSLQSTWGYESSQQTQEMYALLLRLRSQILAETINGEPNALAEFLAKVG